MLMVKKICKSNHCQTAITIAGTILTIILTLWVISGNVSAAFRSQVGDVFDEKLEQFHEVAQPAIEEMVDEKIQRHNLEETLEVQKQLEQIRVEQSKQGGQLDEILRRLDR